MIELFFDMIALKLPFLLSVSRHSCLELVFSLSARFVEANFLFCFCSSWHLQMSLKNWTIKNKKKNFCETTRFFYKLTKSFRQKACSTVESSSTQWSPSNIFTTLTGAPFSISHSIMPSYLATPINLCTVFILSQYVYDIFTCYGCYTIFTVFFLCDARLGNNVFGFVRF